MPYWRYRRCLARLGETIQMLVYSLPRTNTTALPDCLFVGACNPAYYPESHSSLSLASAQAWKKQLKKLVLRRCAARTTLDGGGFAALVGNTGRRHSMEVAAVGMGVAAEAKDLFARALPYQILSLRARSPTYLRARCPTKSLQNSRRNLLKLGT